MLPFVTYVINLDRYPERYATVSALLAEQQIPCERIRAVDGRTRVFTDAEIDLVAYERNHGRPPRHRRRRLLHEPCRDL